MLKEIKIKDMQKVQIMGEYGSNKPILHIDGEIYKLEKEEEYIKLLGSKNVKIVYEVEDEILDEQEKKYLSNLIRPFRDRVDYIEKMPIDDDSCYIEISIDDEDDSITLPIFDKDDMYLGMELWKEYKPEELGL